VHLYTDESGDFLLPDDRFDCYSQAVVLCPDSCLGHVGDFVSGCCKRWGLEELHAHQMTEQMLLEVCEFFPKSGCSLLAMVTDTELVSADDIFRFRLAQAAANRRGLDRYHSEGGQSEEIAAFTDRNIKRVGLEAQIPDGQFIQAQFLVLLLGRGIQKAVLWYQAEEWDEDLGRFTFVADRKLPGKLSMGEKYLDDVIVPALASREGALDVPEAWHERPDHPFLEAFEREHARVRGREVADAIDLGDLRGRRPLRGFPRAPRTPVGGHRRLRRATGHPRAGEHDHAGGLRPAPPSTTQRGRSVPAHQSPAGLRPSDLARALPTRAPARAGSARRLTPAMTSAGRQPSTAARGRGMRYLPNGLAHRSLEDH